MAGSWSDTTWKDRMLRLHINRLGPSRTQQAAKQDDSDFDDGLDELDAGETSTGLVALSVFFSHLSSVSSTTGTSRMD